MLPVKLHAHSVQYAYRLASNKHHDALEKTFANLLIKIKSGALLVIILTPFDFSFLFLVQKVPWL